jgi:hypothetical protein
MSERLDALTVRESNDKSFWTKIGVAWPNKNGPGFIVRLDAMPAPVEGQFVIHLREPLPKDRSVAVAKPAPGYPTNAGSDLDDDLDSVPF